MAKLPKSFMNEAGNAFYEEGEIELKEMKAITPVESGDLRDSGEIDKPVVKGDSISVTIRFGEGLDYSVIVHEDTERFHPHGQAKFVEQPLNESAPHILKRVAKRMNLEKAVKDASR